MNPDPRDIPSGDPAKTTYGVEMGALWRDDAHERLVKFNNPEEYDDYEVYIYHLVDGEVEKTTEYWDDDQIVDFTDPNDYDTAFLAGHNFPGFGRYGVHTDTKPECPECGKNMIPGAPDCDGSSAMGWVCPDYGWDHSGYMTQKEAIEEGYYVTIEQYLRERYEL